MDFKSVSDLAGTLNHVYGTIYVEPAKDFEKKLNVAVQKITGLNAPDFNKGNKFRADRTWWIPSHQPDFTTALAMSLNEEISVRMQMERGLTEIEVICYNPAWSENMWREQVLVGYRCR